MKVSRIKLPKVQPLLVTLKKQLSVQRATEVTVLAVMIGVTVFTIGSRPLPVDTAGATEAQKQAAEQYQQELIGQVDTVTGAPRDGRDPANQKQTSLSTAASNPTGAGQRVDNPASGVNGNNNRNNPGSNSDPNNTGLNSSGCYYDYGDPGQCVQAHAATNSVLTCEGVRTHGGFPDGVKVAGSDRFGLDKNKNGIACDSGD